MKLFQDFGVRALMATIGGIGYYCLLGIVLWYRMDYMTTESLVALIGTAQAPWLVIIGFYFGQSKAKDSTTGS